MCTTYSKDGALGTPPPFGGGRGEAGDRGEARSSRLLVKVCGMREADNIREVAALGIDMMGFVFYKNSPRYVPMISSKAGIMPDYSEERLGELTNRGAATPAAGAARGPWRVGVFVDEMPQNIVTRVYNHALDFVQLHGNESATMIENLRTTLVPDIVPRIGIIKAVSVGSTADLDRCHDYEGVVDLFLFDTRCESRGGSGEQFDWSVLEAYDGNTPFLLSGGIGPDDAGRISQLHHPMLVGIDLNSRFEIEPGVKDVPKIAQFLTTIR